MPVLCKRNTTLFGGLVTVFLVGQGDGGTQVQWNGQSTQKVLKCYSASLKVNIPLEPSKEGMYV